MTHPAFLVILPTECFICGEIPTEFYYGTGFVMANCDGHAHISIVGRLNMFHQKIQAERS